MLCEWRADASHTEPFNCEYVQFKLVANEQMHFINTNRFCHIPITNHHSSDEQASEVIIAPNSSGWNIDYNGRPFGVFEKHEKRHGMLNMRLLDLICGSGGDALNRKQIEATNVGSKMPMTIVEGILMSHLCCAMCMRPNVRRFVLSNTGKRMYWLNSQRLIVHIQLLQIFQCTPYRRLLLYAKSCEALIN